MNYIIPHDAWCYNYWQKPDCIILSIKTILHFTLYLEFRLMDKTMNYRSYFLWRIGLQALSKSDTFTQLVDQHSSKNLFLIFYIYSNSSCQIIMILSILTALPKLHLICQISTSISYNRFWHYQVNSAIL